MTLGARVPRPVAVSAGVLGAVLTLLWLVPFRHVILQGDDLLNAGRAGHPGGRLSPVEQWQQYVVDYTEVNGRLTDTLVRVVLQGGRGAWVVLGALFVAGTSVLVWAWVLVARSTQTALPEPRVHRRRQALALGALAACVPLLPIALNPRVAGDAVFQLSAGVTHVGTGALLLVAALPLGLLAAGRPLSTRVQLGVLPAFLLVAVSQETAAFTLLALVVGTWIVGAGRSRTLVVATVLAVAGLAYVLLSPGALSRFTNYSGAEPSPDSGFVTLLKHLAVGESVQGSMAQPAMVVALLLLAWLAGSARTPSGRRGAPTPARGLALLALGAAASVAVRWATRPGRLEVIPGQEKYAAGATAARVAVLVVSLLVGLIVTHRLRATIGPVPFLAMVGTSAALAVPSGLGITGERAFWLSTVFAWLLVVVLLGVVARESGTAPATVLLAGAVLVAVVIAAPTAARVRGGMAANWQAWQPTAAQVEAARASGSGEVRIPTFPEPDYLYWAAFDRARYGEWFRLYHRLGSSVELRWP